MSDRSMSDALYGSGPQAEAPAAPATRDEQRAAVLYGGQERPAPDVGTIDEATDILDARVHNGGEVPASYDVHLDMLFDMPEREARTAGNAEQVEQFRAAREALSEGLRELQVGDADAREIFAMVDDYRRWPRSAEAKVRERAQTHAELRERYGDRTDRLVAGANKVMQALDRRAPGFTQLISSTGMGNDPRFVSRLIAIARRRGFA